MDTPLENLGKFIAKGGNPKEEYHRKFPVKRGMAYASKYDLNVQGRLATHGVEGWENIDVRKLILKDISGQGYGKTILITSPGSEPEKIVLHAKTVGPDMIDKDNRIQDAVCLLTKVGLTPERISQGDDWYIEEFCGESTMKNPNAIQFGKLLAKIHKIPTDWFKIYREKSKKRYPFLEGISDGSSLWLHCCNDQEKGQYEYLQSLNLGAADIRFYDDLEPLSEVSKRVVTSHGDFHGGNALKFEDGTLIACDLENMHVGYAHHDIGYHFCISGWQSGVPVQNLEYRTAFAKAYLEESGLDSTDQDIDNLLYDAAFATINYSFFSLLHNDITRKKKYQTWGIDYPMQYYETIRSEWFREKRSDEKFFESMVVAGQYYEHPELQKTKEAILKKYGYPILSWKRCWIPTWP